jgi:hypothetical protein
LRENETETFLQLRLDRFLPDGQITWHIAVILRCGRSEPRRMGHGLSSFEAREELAPQDDGLSSLPVIASEAKQSSFSSAESKLESSSLALLE